MTPDKFRTLALSLPETVESAHMNHPDFRVGGKIFATIGPDGDWAMVKVTPELQTQLVSEEPVMFEPVNGAWGKQGCTRVNLKKAKVAPVREALLVAWRRTAPKKLLRELDAS